MHPRLVGWKRKLIDEMVEYYLNFMYLAFFLVPFFAFKELEEVLGKDKLRGLFWRRGGVAASEGERV